MSKKKTKSTRDAQLYRAAVREGFWRGAEKMMQHVLDYWPVSARDEHWRRAYRRSAHFDGLVADDQRACDYYSRRPEPLPAIGGGLEEPREGEVSADA